MTLEISGPYALFRHTRIYGRALASLVPRLAWCNGYRIEADCMLGGEPRLGRLVLGSGDPIGAARELRPFDSKLEERFARTFVKLAPEWDVTREPLAVPVGDSLMFPDFELVHRATGQRWLLEIAGYWTPEYVRRKLALLPSSSVSARNSWRWTTAALLAEAFPAAEVHEEISPDLAVALGASVEARLVSPGASAALRSAAMRQP